jgi:hypothetical protein
MRTSLFIFPVMLCSASCSAFAHSFVAPYSLPVPFALYAYGASTALVLSFVLVGLFSRLPASHGQIHRQTSARRRADWALPPGLLTVLRCVSVALLLLSIATGLLGTKNPFANFNMTFFWIVFVLGFAYLVAFCGDIYQVINPWHTLCDWVEMVAPKAFHARLAYPAAQLGYYPALALYMVFIWLELFGHTTPRSLSLALLAYTSISLLGAALFGSQAWFRYGEFFGVFLRLIAMMAPLRLLVPASGDPGYSVRMQWRAPFIGLLEKQAEHPSMAVFVLFMLSSTAYDGMHESTPWAELFWGRIYPLVGPLITAGSKQPFVIAAKSFHYWQSLALVLFPLVYLFCCLGFLKITRLLTGSAEPVRSLALRFSFSLVPIAFVYHVTHYYTLLLSQGPAFVKQISDPFGLGWNLFGTAGFAAQPVLVDASVIWHTQVALILLGHIVSVYLAHVEALRTFRSSYRAAISQLPILLLMVCLTGGGLWILSLPIASGQVATPSTS